LKIKWRHFAPLRLGEKWASSFRRRFSLRRKDAKAAKGSPLPWLDLIFKDQIRYYVGYLLRRRRIHRLNFSHGQVLTTERASTQPRRA